MLNNIATLSTCDENLQDIENDDEYTELDESLENNNDKEGNNMADKGNPPELTNDMAKQSDPLQSSDGENKTPKSVKLTQAEDAVKNAEEKLKEAKKTLKEAETELRKIEKEENIKKRRKRGNITITVDTKKLKSLEGAVITFSELVKSVVLINTFPFPDNISISSRREDFLRTIRQYANVDFISAQKCQIKSVYSEKAFEEMRDNIK